MLWSCRDIYIHTKKKTTNENPKIRKSKKHIQKITMFPETDPEIQIVQPSRLDAPGHGILVPQRHRGLAGLALAMAMEVPSGKD